MKGEEQLRFEAEGAAAALANQSRDDCPYNRETNPAEWNHWVYGHDIASHEQKAVKDGYLVFCSTAEGASTFRVPLEQAVSSGMWTPQYVQLTKKSS